MTVKRFWNGELISRTHESIVLSGTFERAVDHSALGRIVKGTRSIETFYFDKWFNYFIFQEPAGSLRNYYFNICMPPAVEGSDLKYVDLDIDIIWWPDGSLQTLDLDEFYQNADSFGYSEEAKDAALTNVKRLEKEVVRLNPKIEKSELDLILQQI